MARIYADIRNFKQLEAILRETTLAVANAVKKIEQIQAGKRTKAELETLARARESWIEVHEVAKRALRRFWDDVEGSK